MEVLFNESFAARLQYVTFPLELIGITLALIEVRFPRAAAYLTGQIERLSMPIQEMRAGEVGAESLMERSLATLLSRVVKAGLYVLTAIYVVQLIYLAVVRWPEMGWLVGFGAGFLVTVIAATVALIILGLTLFFLVVGGSDFAQRFVAGRAIGTLGILIAGLGLLGELYQFLTQLVH